MTTKTDLLRTIRRHCFDCCSGSINDVESCPAGTSTSELYPICELHPYRFGTDPTPPEVSEARRQASKSAMAEIHRAKKEQVQTSQPS